MTCQMKTFYNFFISPPKISAFSFVNFEEKKKKFSFFLSHFYWGSETVGFLNSDGNQFILIASPAPTGPHVQS